jgi:thiol-disulfide isomerase/thioredoxin
MQLIPGIVALIGAAPLFVGPVAGDHGRLDWFQGTFEEALAKAKKEQKLVFVDFWASWCGWCTKFDIAVLSDTPVVTATRDLVCLAIDAESATGQPLAARYGVAGLPSLVFIEPDGSLRERLSGFRPPAQFVQEIRRIRANEGTIGEIEKRLAANPDDIEARLEHVIRLRRMHDPRWEKELQEARERIEGGRGFDPKSPDQRFAIARKLRMCSDEAGYQEQLAKIRELDPEGRSVPMRRLALNERVEGVNARYSKERVFDPAPIQAFLAEEKHPLVLFDGYSVLYSMSSSRAEEAFRGGDPGIAAKLRAEAREYGRRAFQDCPPDRLASFGRELAQGLLDDPELTDEDRKFAVEVAAKASEAAPRSAGHLEILASCLEMAGRREEAIAALRRSLELDPSKESVRRRIADLER